MRTTRVLAAAAAAILSISMLAGACSSSDDNVTASKKADTAGATPGKDGSSGETASGKDFSTEVEARGEPTVSKADVPEDLVITDDVVGTGKEVNENSIVTVQYVGAAASTGKVFESSWQSGQPATFPLSGVIEGWSKGLLGMKEGGRRTLVIPAGMAYGNGGPAPGDALVFTVDLIRIDNG